MRFSKIYLLFLIVSLFTIACSKLQDEIVVPAKLNVHDANVLNPISSSFHGVTVKEKGLGSCKQCHAAKFDGGTAKSSCSTIYCHPNIVVHQSGINNPASADFHGKFIAAKKIPMKDCNQCHGDNYTGGIASPSCANCHSKITVHKSGINDPLSSSFHGKFIASNNWNMTKCTECHSNNYSGGIASPSCNSCHKSPGGPEACNTCHGDFSNVSLIAPPRSLNNAVVTTDPGVGAHTLHLKNTKIGSTVACNECHTIPNSLYSAGHLDSTPKAEVIFGTFSSTGNVKGSYNSTAFTCANTYCHGNFEFSKSSSSYQFAYTEDKMKGSNFSPIWNKVDGTQAKCGTCHGLPPIGHISSELRSCSTCHQGIVDNKGNIIDSKKHMDGKINVFGN